MELPPYHVPSFRSVMMSAWEKSFIFLKKAGTLIVAGVIIVWILNMVPAGSSSLLEAFGKFIAPVFAPAGFGFWQATVALLSGIVAKETVVGTLGTLFGGSDLPTMLATFFTPASAFSFMLMTLLYIPCIATIAVIKQEAGPRWASIATFWSFFVGWTLSVLVFQTTRIF